MPNLFFLHVLSGRSWPTDDPHQWLLDHRDDDLLAASRERLILSPGDPARCLRAAIRRTGVALVRVVAEDKIVVQHWGEPPPDMRMWAKEHGWAKPGVAVSFENVKGGSVVVHENGRDILMYGEQVGPKFPRGEYIAKHERRVIEENDDQDAAPESVSNFVWANCPNETINWKVLKAIWNSERIECPNCDVPMFLTSVGWHKSMLSFRSARLHRHCPRCRRRFEAHEPEPLTWLASVLPPHLRPVRLEQWRTFEIDWSSLGFKHRRPVQVAGQEE